MPASGILAGKGGAAIASSAALAVFLVALNHGTYAPGARYGLGVAVWWALALAVALALWPRDRLPRGALAVGAALGALAAFTALSIAWSDSAEKAFGEFDRVLLYLGVFALAVVAAPRGSARRWSDGIALGLAGIGLLALASRLFPGLVGQGDLPRFLPGVGTRLSYPLDYWNGLAIAVALCFPLLLRAAVAARSPVGKGIALAPVPALAATIYLTSSRTGVAVAVLGSLVFVAICGRTLAAAAAAAFSAAGTAGAVAVLAARPQLVDGPLSTHAAVSQGRSAAILIALLCIAVGGAWAAASLAPAKIMPGGLRTSRSLKGVAAVLVLGAVAVAALAVDPVDKFERFKRPPVEITNLPRQGFTEAHLRSANGSGRWQLWGAALDEFGTRPAVGRGAGSYEAWWAQHGSLAAFVRDAHSLYLETMGELGVTGLFLLALFFAAAVVTGVRRLLRSASTERVAIAAIAASCAAFAVALTVDWMWELTAVGAVGILCLGVLVGPATLPGAPATAVHARTLPGKSSPRALGLRGGFVLLSLAAIVCQAIPLLAQARIRESQNAARRGDGAAAARTALAARALQPWAASPYLQLALVREQAGDLGDARLEVRRAIERDPSDWRLWLTSARIDTKAGAVRQARQSLDRAKALNPRSPLFASPR